MDPGLLDALPQLLLPLPVAAEAGVAVGHGLVEVELAVGGEAGHEAGGAERQGVAAVRLPQVVDLAVQPDHVAHLARLGRLPRLPRARHRAAAAARGPRHDQHPRLHLVHVRVPQLPLRGGQRFIECGRDHVLDPDEPRGRARAVVQDALADVWGVLAPT